MADTVQRYTGEIDTMIDGNRMGSISDQRRARETRKIARAEQVHRQGGEIVPKRSRALRPPGAKPNRRLRANNLVISAKNPETVPMKKKAPKPRNPMARELAQPKYRSRQVAMKTTYRRHSRNRKDRGDPTG
jgi:hypothetical protein